MKKSLLIPGIAKKTEKVLKKLKLKPEISPAEFIRKTEGRKHRYYSICRDEKGEKFLLYARLYKSLYEKERMMTEVKLVKALSKKPIEFFPKYYLARIEKNFEWILREYFKVSPLERKESIEKLKRKLKEWEIKKIVRTLWEMNNLPMKDFPFLKNFDLKKYFILPEQILRENIFDQKEIERLIFFLEKNKNLFEKENKYFCHGDFQIGNIILWKGKVRLIDLESANFNNFAFDLAFLTTRLWQEREMRKKFIEEYFMILPETKKEIFKILFPLDCLFIGFHAFMQEPREHSKKKIKERKEFCKRLLKNSLKGFEALINL